MSVDTLSIAFVGLGEAGAAIVGGWGAARAGQIAAYDLKLEAAATQGEIEVRCAGLGIACARSLAAALRGADIVFCTVTADQAVAAARAGAAHLRPGAFWCDLNSCAPSSKTEAAAVIDAAGGRYVDVAVMSPVYPKRHLVPLLISGEHAAAVAPILTALPMAFDVVDGPVGRASSIKMVRSIMVKGLEALTAECALAAVAAGVVDEVLPSLKSGHPQIDVEARALYNFERSFVHGVRRAAEMEEVAKMLGDLGLPSGMSAASAHWQRLLGEADLAGAPTEDLHAVAGLVRPRISGAAERAESTDVDAKLEGSG